MFSKPIAENLFLIELNQPITGFRNFIGAWLYHGKALTFVVDPGPTSTIDKLIEALERFPVRSLDYILLTHIHIDHAGGAGKLLERFPEATVICHPLGIDHMINPEKLWQGSLKVLGDLAKAYQKIHPVRADRIRFTESISTAEGSIELIKTPGHAAHHVCYQFKDLFFVGEAAGVRHQSGSVVYTRPATPPVFKLEISLASLDKVIELHPANLCFGHYGFLSQPANFLTSARKQLLLWVDIVQQSLEEGEDDLEPRIVTQLKQKDPLISSFDDLGPDIHQREDYFLGNSIKGMVQYLQNQSQS